MSIQKDTNKEGYLILTRRVGEAVMFQGKEITGDMEMRILGINGNQIRIGFKAPKSVNIVREELLAKKKEPV